MVMKNIKLLKNIQYLLFISSVALLILSSIFVEMQIVKPISLSYKNLFHYSIYTLQNFSCNIDNISLYLTLQMSCLLIFFGIALYIGLKILPMRLSDDEKREVVRSPYTAYSEFISSKISFRYVVSTTNIMFDFRNVKFINLADFYLFIFNFSDKGKGLIVMFMLGFIFPFLIDMEYQSPVSLLFMNFVHIIVCLVVLTEFILFIYCNYAKSERYAWS
jgi:hypothetical protein